MKVPQPLYCMHRDAAADPKARDELSIIDGPAPERTFSHAGASAELGDLLQKPIVFASNTSLHEVTDMPHSVPLSSVGQRVGNIPLDGLLPS